MANYQETRAKLTNTQLNKLKSVGKNKTVAILRTNKKNFEDEELPHELFLTTRQTKINKKFLSFLNNMSTDTKLSKAEISKIIQSGGSFTAWLGSLGEKVITDLSISLAKDNLSGSVSRLVSNSINKFERKHTGKGAERFGCIN